MCPVVTMAIKIVQKHTVWLELAIYCIKMLMLSWSILSRKLYKMNFVSHCIHRNVLRSPDIWAMTMSRDPICVMYEFSTLVTFVGDVVGAGIF